MVLRLTLRSSRAVWLLALLTAGCAGTRTGGDLPSGLGLVSLEGDARPGAEVERELRSALEAAQGVGDGLVPPQLLDEYVASATSTPPDSVLLWSAFRRVLADADRYTTDTSRAHVERHLALSDLLYTDGPPLTAEMGERAAHALRWWMSQQTAPASGLNERAVAHLHRVAHAQSRYASRTRPTGLDARGEMFVRYGAPSRTRTVRFDEPDLLRSFFRDGLPVRTTDFPNNEFWVYDQLGPMGAFLFVEAPRGGGYTRGGVNDLLPRQLRSRGVSGSARGNAFALASLRALRYIFSQLSLFHPTYGPRFDAIAGYVNWQEEQTITQRSGRTQAGIAGYDGLTQAFEGAIARNVREDERIEERQRAELPDEFARVDRAVMPLAYRVARRLGPDGSTEVQVFWQSPADGYQECTRRTGIPMQQRRSRLIAYGPGFGSEAVVLDATVEGGAWDQLQRHTLPLAEPLEALALQVDGWAGSYLGSCTGVARSGPLAPLDLRAEGVALSDFLPFEVRDLLAAQGRLSAADFTAEHVAPFLRPDLSGEEALGIYFEVYALSDLDDGYVLEYEVVRRTRGGLLRRSRTQSSIYQARRTVVDRRLPAAFLIDRTEWEGADEVEVVVTVTNLETGASVEREMTFQTGR